MAEIHNLLDTVTKKCENLVEGDTCGSVKFNLLKSGNIQCALCEDIEETQMVFNLDSLPKFNNSIVGIMAATGDDFQTVIKTLVGLGVEMAKANGCDGEAHLASITD